MAESSVLAFRALHPSDADRPIGSTLRLPKDTPAALDSRIPTDDFAHAELVMLFTRVAQPEGDDVVVPAGTDLVVRGRRSFEHHLASAVDITVTVLFVADPDIDESACDTEFTRAMLMLSMSMAGGDSGRGHEAPRFTGSLT